MRMYHPIIQNKQNNLRFYYYQGNLCLHTYLLFSRLILLSTTEQSSFLTCYD